LLTFSVSFGQKTISDLLQEVPQGQKGIRQFTKIIKSDSNIAEAYWRRGKKICVTSKVIQYKGKPEIIINDPKQIKIEN